MMSKKYIYFIFAGVVAIINFSTPACNACSDDEKIYIGGFRLIKCIDASLRSLPPGSIPPQLPIPKDMNPVNDWVEFADILHRSSSYNEYNLIWTELASKYAEITSIALTSAHQKKVLDTYFLPEITIFKIDKRANYEWFVLFVTRLTFLLTEQDFLECTESSNVEYFEYTRQLYSYELFGNKCWYFDDLFKLANSSVGATFTREFLSPFSLLRRARNDVLLLPYPFSLGFSDIFCTIPSPNGSKLWLNGFVTSKVVADGGMHHPAAYLMHDHLHFIVWLLSIQDGFSFYILSPRYSLPEDYEQWNKTREKKKVLFELIETLQHFHKSIKKDNDFLIDVEYFGFSWLHERAIDILNYCFKRLCCGDLVRDSVEWISSFSLDDHQPFLPKKLQAVAAATYAEYIRSPDYDEALEANPEFESLFSSYTQQFYDVEKKFIKTLRLYLALTNPNLLIDLRTSQTAHHCANPYRSFSNNIIKFGYQSSGCDLTWASERICSAQRIFGGSVFYTEVTPPTSKVYYRRILET